jgi:hypothetical protein
MLRKRKKILITLIIIVSIFIIIPITLIALLLSPRSFILGRPIKIAWSSMVLDNKENFLPCKQMPSISEVKNVFNNNQQLLENVIDNPGAVTIEEGSTASLGMDQWKCEGKADILFVVGGYSERKRIEKQFGESVFGIPYRIVDV